MIRRYKRAKEPRKSRKELLLENGGSYTEDQWKTLKFSFDHRCVRCGRKEGSWNGWIRNYVKLHADHIIPVTKGGSSNIDNIQPLCQSCNTSKGNRNDIDYRSTFFTEFIDQFDPKDLNRIVMVRARMYMRLEFEANKLNRENALSEISSWNLPDEYYQIALREVVEWTI